jgi:uncharacterized protein involved in exopolysaccharide biosynthesis
LAIVYLNYLLGVLVEEEISLEEIFSTLWNGRVKILKIGFIFMLSAVVISLLLPNKYSASIIISPISDDASSGLGGSGALLAQIGGLTGAGVGLAGSSKVAESVATLQSAALTQEFIQEHSLLPILFPDRWDEGGKTWKSDFFGRDPPSIWGGEKLFSEDVRSISEDRKTGLLTLTIKWVDPELAAIWANELVEKANQRLRTEAINISEKNISFLHDQLEKTSVVQLQSSIYGLIELEIKKIMLAKGSNEYAFRIIDPARIPEEKISPRRTIICISALFFGFCLGSIWVLFKANRKNAH